MGRSPSSSRPLSSLPLLPLISLAFLPARALSLLLLLAFWGCSLARSFVALPQPLVPSLSFLSSLLSCLSYTIGWTRSFCTRHARMGTLLDGQTVAVKQLFVASPQGKSQLLAEIATISAVQHRNLVKLHGCCIEGANQLLVYEYLENKSLDQALFGNSNLHLDWHTRFKICLGTARGLAYLHEESRPRIVHRDIKASNILLDADLNPKISDFGLAKLYDDKMTHMSTRVAGTIGYLAPEYAMRGHLTEKADVFGFGVLTLEIVSGRPNTCQNVDLEKMYLLEWAWHLHENNRALELVDPKLSNFDEGEAARMISIALLCIQALPSLRPPMSRVVNMLLGEIEVGAVSSKPSYLTGLPSDDTGSFMTDDTSRASASVTITSQQFSSWYESSSSLGATRPMLHEDISDGR